MVDWVFSMAKIINSVLFFCALVVSGLTTPQAFAEKTKKQLSAEQIAVTRQCSTETPFKNKYWNNHEDGIYVDLYTGEALYSSLDKYDSGTGWPSFTKPIDSKNIKFKKDKTLGVERIEVKSNSSDSHLGHVFDDGPKKAGGKRYCMNSAAMDFVPLKEMKDSKYSQYLFLFAKKKNWEIATLAGGCFWGTENLLRQEKGVIETQTGYSGGKIERPTYEDVSTGKTGYAESVQILFDPKETSYESLLLLFFRMHDPTTLNQQENDKGTQYRSAIFYENDEQKKVAEKVIKRVSDSNAWKKPIVTEVTKFNSFWRAEENHQKYLKKNPKGYNCHFIRKNIKF